MIFEIVDPLAHVMGEWASTINIYSIILRIALAIILGACIGWERSNKRHAAGLRTFILAILTTSCPPHNGHLFELNCPLCI